MKTKMMLAAAVLFSSGAVMAAEVQGPWIEARAGWDDVGGSSGLLYGGAVGYDFAASDKIFVGLQAGIAGSTAKECEFGVCATAGRDIEVLGRLGGHVAEKTALYALAGYANSRFGADVEGFDLGTNLSGFRAGAGVEQSFGGKTYGKLEYRFTTYGNGDIEGETVEGGNRHQVSVSFGIRF